MLVCSQSVSPIIVIGMHRSGTSLVSRLLQGLGVHMGADTTKTEESIFFRELNRNVMRAHGALWHDPAPMWQVFSDSGIVQSVARQLQSACESAGSQAYRGNSFGATAAWGWKDPRNTINLPVWLTLFPSARVVHVVRNGIDVADSLVRRSRLHKPVAWSTRLRIAAHTFVTAGRLPNGTLPFAKCRFRDHAHAFDLWRHYMAFADYHAGQVSASRLHTLRFEDLAERPEQELMALARFAGASQKDLQIAEAASSINRQRAWSFTDDDNLADFADTVVADQWMQRYGYIAGCRFSANAMTEVSVEKDDQAAPRVRDAG